MYQLQPLPFLYQDLEPFIDTHTMGLHYQKHQRNYLNQLNLLLEKIIIIINILLKPYISIYPCFQLLIEMIFFFIGEEL